MDKRTIRAKEKWEGKEFYTINGKRKFTILEFISGSDIIIQFNNTDYIRHVSSYDLGKGIHDPFDDNCPILFEDAKLKYLGNYYRSNISGDLMRVVEYIDSKHATVEFENGYRFTTSIRNIMNGEVRNPYAKNKFGGYLGEGKFRTTQYEWLYRLWYDMLIRGNDTEYYLQYHGNMTDTYDNTIVGDEWFNYNNFALWYINELSKLNQNYTYNLDKDILYPYYSAKTNEKKVYSSETCALIPSNFNKYITSRKITKNDLISEATKYYNDNALSPRIYTIICSDEYIL